MATVTTGVHRFSNVTQRSQYGTLLDIVPGATIYVTQTASGSAATIYSDAAMSVVITGSRITADPFGWYQYYIPLNYNVTETITSSTGLNVTVSNIVGNGVLSASLTTSSGTSDVVSIPGFTTSGHVSLTPTNASAATMSGSVYVSAKSANSITVTHPATSGATFDILATTY